MKIYLYSLLLLLNLFVQNSFAQITLTGYLNDTKQRPISYANVILASLPDSSYVVGGVTNEDGFFEIKTNDRKNFIIKFSSLGFLDYIANVSYVNDSLYIGVINMEESSTQLDEIIVKSIRPRTYSKGGKLITEIGESSLKNLGNGKDLLKYIPGIISSKDKIEVFGKGTPIIYIDNKRMNNQKELELIRSENIQRIELITNPGAEYEAETRSVLKIITNRKLKEGFSMILDVDISHNNRMSHNEGISMNYNNNELNVYFSYYYNKMKNTVQYQINQVSNDKDIYNEISSSKYNYNNDDHSYSLGFSYDINDKISLGTQLNSYNVLSKIYSNPNADWLEMYKNSMLVAHNSNHLDEKEKERFYNPNIYFEIELANNIQLHIDGDYVFNRTRSIQNIVEKSLFSNINMETDILNLTKNKVFAIKGILKQSHNKIHEFNYGIEYSDIIITGEVNNDDGRVPNISFKNQENKYAAFFQYRYNTSKVDTHIGVRFEHINSLNTELMKAPLHKRYSDLLPSIAISFPIKEIVISASFTNRINRPSFNQLNSKVNYNNIYHQEKGNPNLSYAKIYDTECLVTYKFLNFKLNYQNVKDYIYMTVTSSSISEGSSIWHATNAPHFKQMGAVLIVAPAVKNWRPTFTAGVYKQLFNLKYDGNILNYNKPYALFSLVNELLLPSNYILRGDIYWTTRGNRGIYENYGSGSCDISVQKSFISNQLNLKLSSTDIFNWKKSKDIKSINYIYSQRHTNTYARSINISLSWYFNNMTNYYKGKSAASQEINRL